MSKVVRCKASPSLALVKYWGKADSKQNLPATPSLALTLKELVSETTVRLIEKQDQMIINGVESPAQRSAAFFDTVRRTLGVDHYYDVESCNNFPTAAGLASSSSGFAALAAAAVRASGAELSLIELSALARVGSASAARAVFGGFTLLDAGAEHAVQLYDENYWADLRVVVVRIDSGPKKISSRDAMQQTKESSPYFAAWVDDAPKLLQEAKDALQKRDLEKLGQTMRCSYLRMFATMFAADPPILYWKPASLAVIHACERLRSNGISCWETMDAGPQVKIFCDKADLSAVISGVGSIVSGLTEDAFLIASPGSGVCCY